MGITATEKNTDSKIALDLTLHLLPAYAKYLLEHKLDAFSRHQLELAKRLRVPMLKHMTALSDEQFYQITLKSVEEMLNALVEKKSERYIQSSIDRWQSNAMPIITRDQIGVEDITLVWHIRRNGFVEFLNGFTTDTDEWKSILTEIDAFTSENVTRALSVLVNVQQDLYNQAQRLSGIGNYVWDIVSNKFTWSDELYRIYEWEPGSEVNYTRVMNGTHPDDLSKANAYMQHLFNTRQQYDHHYRIITGSGREKIVHAKGTLHFDSHDKPFQMIGTLQDVTASRKSNEALQRYTDKLRTSEEQFRLLVSGVKDYAIFMLNPDGTVATWNAGAERIKQYKAEEIIGKHFSIFYTPEDMERDHPSEELEIAIRTGSYEEEGWRVRKDGTHFWANVVITTLRDEKGTLRGFAKVTRDMTERMLSSRRLEETVHELERSNKELSSFSYAASHDLQEPLRKIQTFTSRILAKDADQLSENSKDLFSRLTNAASRMQRLIDDLLMYSRVGTQVQLLADVDLNAVLEDIRATHKNLYGEKQVSIVASRLPIIYGSAVQLSQLFENLISNSIKYAKPDQPPVIRIDAEAVMVPTNGARRGGKFCRITVADNGIGFESEYSDRIFEMFQRLHSRMAYEGSGIGLSIVKKIVQNHGGFIEAKGEPNKGATFSIYLPTWKSGDSKK